MVDTADHYQFGSPDQKRFRAGIVILVMGIVLVIWAWGSWIYRSSGDTPVSSNIDRPEDRNEPFNPAADDTDSVEVARTLPTMLMYGFILFVVVLVATFILVRTTRRYLAAYARKRAPPTAANDIWSTHKLPDDDVKH